MAMRARAPTLSAAVRIAAGGLALLAATAFVPGDVFAGDKVWHTTLDKGVESAKKSGKPLLIVTAWKSRI